VTYLRLIYFAALARLWRAPEGWSVRIAADFGDGDVPLGLKRPGKPQILVELPTFDWPSRFWGQLDRIVEGQSCTCPRCRMMRILKAQDAGRDG
jgi:hypothetical protein